MIICDPFREQFGHCCCAVHSASGAGDFLQECHLRKFDTSPYIPTQTNLPNNSHPLLKVKLIQLHFLLSWIQCFHVARFQTQPTDLLQKILSYFNLTKFLCTGNVISLGKPRHTFPSSSCSSSWWLINWYLRRGETSAPSSSLISPLFIIINIFVQWSIDTWDEEEGVRRESDWSAA